MKSLITIVFIPFLIISAKAQNIHPMHIAMVSVIFEDPAKAFAYNTDTLGFEEVMYQPENYIAIGKSPSAKDGPMVLLEPTEPAGLEIAKNYKKEIYTPGTPVMSFGTKDIYQTTAELKKKSVRLKKDNVKTDWGHTDVFDDSNGNYIQLIQMNDP